MVQAIDVQWIFSAIESEADTEGDAQVTWVQVGKVDELETGQMKSILVKERRIALYHLEDGFHATAEVCTHSGKSLTRGTLYGSVVTCPAHGGKFDVISGKAKAFPCTIPLKTYSLEIRDNEIWISI